MPAIKIMEPPQLLVDWHRLGGEDRRCNENRHEFVALTCIPASKASNNFDNVRTAWSETFTDIFYTCVMKRLTMLDPPNPLALNP